MADIARLGTRITVIELETADEDMALMIFDAAIVTLLSIWLLVSLYVFVVWICGKIEARREDGKAEKPNTEQSGL